LRVFGSSNQLLAALTLLTFTVGLKRSGKPWWVSAVPAAFVMVMTVWSLLLLMRPWLVKLAGGMFRLDAVPLTAARAQSTSTEKPLAPVSHRSSTVKEKR
jgi:carbon starvation protein CstA